MKFTVAALALFCVIACVNAGLPRGGGPPRSTGPTFPRGGFRFRRDVIEDEEPTPMRGWIDVSHNQGGEDLAEEPIRNLEEEQPVPVFDDSFHRLPRGRKVIKYEEVQY